MDEGRWKRWPEKRGRYSVGLVPRVPSDVSSRRNACMSDVRRPMYIIYEVSAFPTMINQAATRQEPRAFEALRRGEKPCPVQTLRAFFFRNPSLLLLFLPPQEQTGRLHERKFEDERSFRPFFFVGSKGLVASSLTIGHRAILNENTRRV